MTEKKYTVYRETGNVVIRLALPEDIDSVIEFYNEMIDGMQSGKFKTTWKKGKYPSREYLLAAIADTDLIIGVKEGKVCCAAVANNKGNEKYSEVDWPTKADTSRCSVIHTLGVLPSCSGQGVAHELLQGIIEHTRRKGRVAIRLDVLDGNTTAETLYQTTGFRYVDTIDMYFEHAGWKVFKVMEYPMEY